MLKLNAPLSIALASFILTSTPGWAHELQQEYLTLTAPSCKATKAKRPQLPPKLGYDYTVIDIMHDDFNGDGWCDYAVGISYPRNSKMNSFSIEDMILLGGAKGWKPPLHGIKTYMLDKKIPNSEEMKLYATFQADLTNIKLIYLKNGGAPYVIGLITGIIRDDDIIGPQVEARRREPTYCEGKHRVNFFRGWVSVYRWDDWAGTFKRVLGNDRQTVLDFEFNQAVKACNKEVEADATSQ